jgi:hypothetical protein
VENEAFEMLEQRVLSLETTSLVWQSLMMAMLRVDPNRELIHEIFQERWNTMRGALREPSERIIKHVATTIDHISKGLDKHILYRLSRA